MRRTKLPLLVFALLVCIALAAQLVPTGAVAKKRPPRDVAPDDPPIGVPIDTLGDRGVITIGGESYGGSSDATDLSYVVLQRNTRKEVTSGHVSGDRRGINQLLSIAGDYSTPYTKLRFLMIVSGRQSPARDPQEADDTFSLLKKLGAELMTPSEAASVTERRPSFSIIGIPGAARGAATVRIAAPSSPDSGAITGYLQKNYATKIDNQPAYDYVSPEYPSFDTRAEGSTDRSNVIVVGTNRYETGLSGSQTAGFHVLILNSLTLQRLWNFTIVTNSTDPSPSDREHQKDAASTLQRFLDSPSGQRQLAQPDVTVFVQSIGKPKAAGPEWAALVSQLLRLGANIQYLNALNGANEYAIVDRLGSSLPPAEASTASDSGARYPPARLVGVLGRTRMSTFEPKIEGAPSPGQPTTGAEVSLIKVAYQPLQPWPKLAPDEPDRKRATAAANYVCDKLDLCPAKCPDIRACYWKAEDEDWGHDYGVLSDMPYPADRSCELHPAADDCFSAKTFAAVKDQLKPEFDAVLKVRNYIRSLEVPFDSTKVDSYVNLQAISRRIVDALRPPEADHSTARTLELISKVVSLAKAAPPPGNSIASGIAASLSLAAFLSDEKGQPFFGGVIEGAASQLATQLVTRWNAARKEMDALYGLIVSDYGKLTAAKEHLRSDWIASKATDAADLLRSAAEQWFWQTLIPVAYPDLIRGNTNNARELGCQVGSGWPAQGDAVQMQATVGYDPRGAPIKGIFFFARGIFGDRSSPPNSFGEDMFLPSPSGLGIEKLAFFTPSVFGGQILHAVNGALYCGIPSLIGSPGRPRR